MPYEVIATSGPSSTYPQRAYRNPTDALVQFLDKKHQSNWAIWEFRAEGTGYPDSEVYGRINHYPWPDHHPPPFALIPNMMASMRNWLKDSRFPDRVVVVHCKAGKGRSGTVACSYLISEEGWAVEDALKRFTERRMRQGFGAGVSIPSQLRWVGYVHRWAKHKKLYVERQIEILEVHVWGIRDGVKVAVEGYVDEGKTIKTFHVFSKEERIVIDGTAHSTGIFAGLTGLNNERKVPKTSTSSQLDGAPTGQDTSTTENGSNLGLEEEPGQESGTSAVIYRPSTRIILPTNDINIDFERRNKAAYGFAMVTAVAHVWFNAFFEGQGAENGGKASSDGVFEIEWDAMDGIKGSSRKGIRALDRIAVVWQAIDAVGEGVSTVITEPPEGTHVPDVRPADWRGANPEQTSLGRDLGLRAETPASAHISRASSADGTEGAGNDDPQRGVQSYGLDGGGHVDTRHTDSMARTQTLESSSLAGIVSGMKHVATGDLPDGKPEDEMKTSHDHVPGHLERTRDVGKGS